MDAPPPIQLFRAMIGGSLRPAGSLNVVRKSLLHLEPPQPGRPFDYERYLSVMQPVYDQLMRERGVGSGHGMVHEPSTSASPELTSHERLVDYDPGTPPDSETRCYGYVIRGEGRRFLSDFARAWRSNDDPDLRHYELDRRSDSIEELLLLLLSQPQPGRDAAFYIVHHLLLELLALHAHIRLHMADTDDSSEPLVESGIRDRIPEFFPPLALFRTPAYWTRRLHDMLDAWKVGPHNPTPIDELANLLDDLHEESTPQNRHPEYGSLWRQGQVILLLMVLGRITDARQKKRLYQPRDAETQLAELDKLLREDRDHDQDRTLLLAYADRLNRHSDTHRIERFPLIENRYEQLRQISAKMISSPLREKQRETGRRVETPGRVTAAERLKNEFMTIPELADALDKSDRAIRTILRKNDIPTIKRGDTVLVAYDDFVRKGKDS